MKIKYEFSHWGPEGPRSCGLLIRMNCIGFMLCCHKWYLDVRLVSSNKKKATYPHFEFKCFGITNIRNGMHNMHWRPYFFTHRRGFNLWFLNFYVCLTV